MILKFALDLLKDAALDCECDDDSETSRELLEIIEELRESDE